MSECDGPEDLGRGDVGTSAQKQHPLFSSPVLQLNKTAAGEGETEGQRADATPKPTQREASEQEYSRVVAVDLSLLNPVLQYS